MVREGLMSVGRATNRRVLPTHMPPPLAQPFSDSEPSQQIATSVIASCLFHFMKAVVKQSSHRLLLDLLCGRASAKSSCECHVIELSIQRVDHIFATSWLN